MDDDPVQQAYDQTTWGNTTETPDTWRSILNGDDENAKRRLFEHLFMESLDGGVIRSLFSDEEIARFVSTLSRPVSRPHLERRRKVWRRLYCDIREDIPELDWNVRN